MPVFIAFLSSEIDLQRMKLSLRNVITVKLIEKFFQHFSNWYVCMCMSSQIDCN